MGILKKTKTKSVSKVESMDLLLKNFAGELVDIVVDKDLEHPVSANGESVEIVKIPLTVSGYLTDMDDQYIYIGLSINQISQAINKNYVIHIGIADEFSIEMDEEGKLPRGVLN